MLVCQQSEAALAGAAFLVLIDNRENLNAYVLCGVF